MRPTDADHTRPDRTDKTETKRPSTDALTARVVDGIAGAGRALAAHRIEHALSCAFCCDRARGREGEVHELGLLRGVWRLDCELCLGLDEDLRLRSRLRGFSVQNAARRACAM
eukprot:1542669-Rhodomonas_salina.1